MTEPDAPPSGPMVVERFWQRSAVQLAIFTTVLRLFGLLRALDSGSPVTAALIAAGEDIATTWAAAFGITTLSAGYRRG